MSMRIGHRRNHLKRVDGFKWIEIDIILSEKRGLILSHDWIDESDVEGRLTLKESLEWLERHKTKHLILDLKCRGGERERYETTLIKTLEHFYHLRDRLVLSSFDHVLLTRLYSKHPSFSYGAIIEAALVDLNSYLKNYLPFIDFVMVSLHCFSREMATKSTLPVLVYTVSKLPVIKMLTEAGASGYYTDLD